VAVESPWRVVIITQILSIAAGFTQLIRELGHEPVGLLFTRRSRVDTPPPLQAAKFMTKLLVEGPPELDLLVPRDRTRIAPLLEALEPDLVLCTVFPWRIPAEALAVPRLGAVNGHPSLLPRYRGPHPMAWAIRNGEAEIGLTFHRMDEQFDSGPILAQKAVPLDDQETLETLEPKLAAATEELLPIVFERLARGEEGDPQGAEEASYQSVFAGEELVEIDWSRPARDVHNLVRAWRFVPVAIGERGPLGEVDGRRVRVLRTRLEPGEGLQVECGDGPIWVVETEPV
jgi:methionyl-tRNA formyltransferase